MKKRILLLPALLFSLFTQAQSAWLCGVVTDEWGEPMPGVTLQIKGLGGGTTDADGFYQVEVPSGAYDLEFRSIGYETAHTPVFVSEKTVYHQDITLTPATIHLGEVCIVAYKISDIQSCTIYCSTTSCGGIPRQDCFLQNYRQLKNQSTAEPAVEKPVLYPNPAHTFTRLALVAPALEVDIFDAKGVLVHRIQHVDAGVYELATQDLPAGIYSVAVRTGQQTQALPLIVVHD